MLFTNLRIDSNLDKVPLVHINPVPTLRGEEVPRVVDKDVCFSEEVNHNLQDTLGKGTLGKANGPAPTIVIIFSWEENILPTQFSSSLGDAHLLDTAAFQWLLQVQVDALHQVTGRKNYLIKEFFNRF